MIHYAGVMTKKSLPEATRLIQFPEGEYIVVKWKADTDEELSNKLTGIVFWLPAVRIFEPRGAGPPGRLFIKNTQALE